MIWSKARPLRSLISHFSVRGFCDSAPGSKLPTLFDSKGKVIPYDNSLDHFSVFGLYRSFNLISLRDYQKSCFQFVKCSPEDAERSET